MTTGNARTTLQEQLGEQVIEPFEVHAGPLTATVDPLQAGLTANWFETVKGAGVSSGNPFSLAAGLFGSRHVNLPVASDVDEEKLQATLVQLEKQLSRQPVDGYVDIENGEVRITESQTGIGVDPAELHYAITADWLSPGPVTVEPVVTDPAITQDAVDEAASRARSAVSANLVAQGKGGQGLIPTDRMGEIVVFEPKQHRLVPAINNELVTELLAEGLDRTAQEPVNAKVKFVGGTPSVVPAQKGRTVDWEKTLTDFPDRLFGKKPKTWDAVYEETDAEFSTEDAEKLSFDDTLGQASEQGGTHASSVNARKIAEIVDGSVVNPGERFSLAATVGPRGPSAGFIATTDTDDDAGYGTFATAMYKAALLAGMTDFTRSPHAHYNDLYEAGLDATVAPGRGDLAFTNSGDTPVVILARSTGSRVVVTFKGVKTVKVTIDPGEITDKVTAPTTTSDDPDCSPRRGRDGFTTSFTRKIENLSGTVIKREKVTTVYPPSPEIRCVEKQQPDRRPDDDDRPQRPGNDTEPGLADVLDVLTGN
nr:peptidoglycan binding domain-containing protein [Corynebacterium mendelii]